MRVSMWMTRDPFVVLPDTTIAAAAQEMAKRKIRRLPVVDKIEGKIRLVGIVSSTDILHAVSPAVNPFSTPMAARNSSTKVGDIMTRHPLTTDPDAPLEEVARIMRDRKFGALPVVWNDHLVGIITESDIFRALVGIMGADRGGIRISLDLSLDEDVIPLLVSLATKHGMRLASVMSVGWEGRDICVVRFYGGEDAQTFIDEIWSSGHRVLSVTDLGPPPVPEEIDFMMPQ